MSKDPPQADGQYISKKLPTPYLGVNLGFETTSKFLIGKTL
jgi:hypothetical protein